jgi:hypothetical protein
MSCFWGHKWSKWELYVQDYDFIPYKDMTKRIPTSELRQKRACGRCRYREDLLVVRGPTDFGGAVPSPKETP